LETLHGPELAASEKRNGVDAKAIMAICLLILAGFLIYVIMEGKGHKYTFHHDAGGNTGYVFDSNKGTLKIFPIKIGMDGFVPHTIITTKNMEANTFLEIGRNSRMDAIIKRTQEGEKRPGESDEEYRQRLLKLREKLP